MHPPAGLPAGLSQTLQKRRLRFLAPKNIRPVIAPVDHMIHPGFTFHAQRSGHGRHHKTKATDVNYKLQSLTPFAWF
ncbi:MAG: hypothetical protein R3F03_05775 [Opitutaceae bacterium]